MELVFKNVTFSNLLPQKKKKNICFQIKPKKIYISININMVKQIDSPYLLFQAKISFFYFEAHRLFILSVLFKN